jgi:hypothetical protein
MLLGHTAFSEQAFQDARLDAVHNIEFTEAGNVSSYEATFSTGSETVTGTAVVSPDGSSFTMSLGDETAFGEAFQNLITFSTGDLALTIWNETDDSETSTWTLVDPGSTD